MSQTAGDMFEVRSLTELTELTTMGTPLFVRYSLGPDADASETSIDHESGCVLPGLSANPLDPEPWWDRPPEQWVARQLHQYAHLATGPRRAWVLTGALAGRGPDCEPLLIEVHAVAILSDQVLEEATVLYRRTFDVGEDGT